jgi:hypothetical protein
MCMLPSLGYGLTCIILYLMLGTVGCIRIVIDLEVHGLYFVAIFLLSVGKELGRI